MRETLFTKLPLRYGISRHFVFLLHSITELLRYGISRHFVSLLHNIYGKTKLSVQLSDISEFFPSGIGLRQGCNIGPILFNLFINEINSIFDETYCQEAWIGSIAINCRLLYADNLVIVSETSSGLQKSLNWQQFYCEKWTLVVNNKKKVIVAGKGNLSPESTPAFIITHF